MHIRRDFELLPVEQVYCISIVRRLLTGMRYFLSVIACSIMVLFFLTAILTSFSSRVPLWDIFEIFLIVLVFGFQGYILTMVGLWRTQGCLVTSREGISYSTIGHRIFTSWDNIKGINSRYERWMQGKGLGFETVIVTGLELHQPASLFEVSPWVPTFLPAIDQPSFFIPLSQLVPDWENSPLGEDIRHYAPQLLSKM